MAAAVSQPTASYVLVVDDTESSREAVLDLLTDEGIAVIAFADGAAALDHLRTAETLPAAILTDLMMPVLDGWALIEAIRADPRYREVHVVAMTASPFCRGPLGVPLLRKPFHCTDLLGALGSV